MSKYRTMQTEYRSRALLREALRAAGVPFEEARPGKQLELHGFAGQTRFATFAIRKSGERDAITHYADVGWTWDDRTGHFAEVLDGMETQRTQAVRDRVRREYAVAATIAQARTRGLQVTREDQADGRVKLRVVGQVSAAGLLSRA